MGLDQLKNTARRRENKATLGAKDQGEHTGFTVCCEAQALQICCFKVSGGILKKISGDHLVLSF